LQRLGTSACGRPETTTPGGNQIGAQPDGTTTTTTTPGTTPGTGTQPAGNANVDQLLADAKREFQAADAALARGDLGEFQRHFKQAEDDVNRATALRAGVSSTTTTPGP
jgi:regulator of protease activity HflC (stomatin/prohibitin superfamily)